MNTYFVLLLLPYLGFARLQPIDFSGKHPDTSVPIEHHPWFNQTNGDPFLGVKYYSGYMNVGKNGGEMFYWYFPNRDEGAAVDSPFIIWLTGGR